MSEYYSFPCGCKFKILDPKIKEYDGLPSLEVDFDRIPLDCPDTWESLCNADTKGIFQLEKSGNTYSKRIKPRSIMELSDLASVIRPGCTQSKIDGISLTDIYTERKFGRMEIKIEIPALGPILADTYQILVYQEQAIRIARDIAGFSMEEADILRKSIGKKDPQLMTKVEKLFIDGCKRVGIVTEEEAKKIFGWIRESQKYSFNKSHGVGYAYNGYWCAYIKTHFPQVFFSSWLALANNKSDEEVEISDLVFDAKKHDVDVRRPSFKNLNFTIEKGGCRYGLTNIKDIGESQAKKIIKHVVDIEAMLGRDIQHWTWVEFLVHMFAMNSKAINNIIAVGMLDHLGISRQKMLYDYKIYSMLKDKDIIQAKNHASGKKSLQELLEFLVKNGLIDKKRIDIIHDLIKSLKNPSYDLKDTPEFIISKERELLSTPLTFSGIDVAKNAIYDTTCKELHEGKQGGIITIEISEIREHMTKNGRSAGKMMAFVKGRDDTYDISISVFAESYEKYKDILTVGNIINVYVKSNDKGHMATKIIQA